MKDGKRIFIANVLARPLMRGNGEAGSGDNREYRENIRADKFNKLSPCPFSLTETLHIRTNFIAYFSIWEKHFKYASQ